jgi:hypothetical protein
MEEISEGDLDLGEWFMLNAPRPGYSGTRDEYRQGTTAMLEMAAPSVTFRIDDPTARRNPHGRPAFVRHGRPVQRSTSGSKARSRACTRNSGDYVRNWRLRGQGIFTDLASRHG